MRDQPQSTAGNPLFLEDLFVGQRFSSGSHAVSEEIESRTLNQNGEPVQALKARIVVFSRTRAALRR